MNHVRQNLRLHFSHKCNNVTNIESNKKSNLQDVSLPVPSNSSCNVQDNDVEVTCSTNIENDRESSFSSTSTNISQALSLCSSNSSEASFQEHLAGCFVNNNLTHTQGNSVLSILRRHTCFSNLPKDVRTLLDTPRHRVLLCTVEPGEYIHFDLETGIVESLLNACFVPVIRELEIDFNTDGCTLDKSATINLWPIQCRLSNVQNVKPIVVGIYKGTQKPHDANTFFQKFIADVRAIMSNGGISYRGNKIPIRLRCFIADAPARAFILNHRGHTSANPCSKCKVSSTQSSGRCIFNGVNHPLRTDEEYSLCLDEDHHKEGTSPLSLLPIGMVSQVPFEYMHLVCLGVVKKLMSAWVHGKYSWLSKLSARSIDLISARLNILKKWCPSEFARWPRSLEMYSKYKATEFRQFLLYTGPIVTYGVLDTELYKHFLLLHAAIRVLVSKSPSRQHLRFAELALKKFVLRCECLYGANFNSYNVHGLLHLANDVRRLGNLDSFSAFPYENNMSMFRKYCRKPGLPLQQLFNRMSEMRQHGVTQLRNIDSSIRVSVPRNNDNKCVEYCKIHFNGIFLSVYVRDNCCILRDGSICIVENIVAENNCYRLAVKRFIEIDNFYIIGMVSSTFKVFKCGKLSNELELINVNEIIAKAYRMPLCNNISMDNNDSDGDDNIRYFQYVVAAIIHMESV